MQSDWDSLFFQHSPHADQLPNHDQRLLRDIGLTRTETGELALAEDPTHIVRGQPDRALPGRWAQALLALVSTGTGRRRYH